MVCLFCCELGRQCSTQRPYTEHEHENTEDIGKAHCTAHEERCYSVMRQFVKRKTANEYYEFPKLFEKTSAGEPRRRPQQARRCPTKPHNNQN